MFKNTFEKIKTNLTKNTFENKFGDKSDGDEQIIKDQKGILLKIHFKL